MRCLPAVLSARVAGDAPARLYRSSRRPTPHPNHERARCSTMALMACWLSACCWWFCCCGEHHDPNPRWNPRTTLSRGPKAAMHAVTNGCAESRQSSCHHHRCSSGRRAASRMRRTSEVAALHRAAACARVADGSSSTTGGGAKLRCQCDEVARPAGVRVG